MIYLITVFFSVITISVFSQPKIEFESTIYDYGQIKEKDGKQKGVFWFTNTGNEPLKITSVRASCGCTASDYTRDDIPPGKKGFVEATYNPERRPGNFSKSITVSTNDPEHPNIVLTIKGDVIAQPKTKADDYPSKIGNLRFKTNHISLQEITNRQVIKDTLGFYNESKTEITISGTKDLKDFISIEIIPKTLKHDEEGIIIVTYDAGKKDDLGYVFDRFYLVTNDNEMPEKLIYISANISYDFSNLTEKQKTNAPKINFDNTIFEYGVVKSGDIVEHDFIFRNEGKDPLKILKIKPSCGCTTAEPILTTLKRGESSRINVKFNTRGRSGTQHHNITLFTNDLEKPVVVLHLQGEVDKE